MLDSIALAFQKCPKLSNLIVDYPRKKCGPRMNEQPDRFYHDIPTVVTGNLQYPHRWCLESTPFDIWDILKPVHDVNGTLNSLVMFDAHVRCQRNLEMSTTNIFRNLKHFRHLSYPMDFLHHIVAHAPVLESIGIDRGPYGYITWPLDCLVGRSVVGKLRACSFAHLEFREDEMVQFLLHHSNTLQDLRMTHGVRNWDSLVNRMKDQLPNLRGWENSRGQWLQEGKWEDTRLLTGANMLQDREHNLETGLMEMEDGLWEDYERFFFPEKCEF
jgi:hypothetical protein